MSNTPRATYRLQLGPNLDFEAAAGLCEYLAALGVSHLYASPYLQAAPGSTHGYDVVDPGRVNAELGGEAGHAKMLAALRANGLGQILDVVPNHMSIRGTANFWWWDVLENGPSSRYSDYFDVDWEHSASRTANRIMLPILGDHYGRVLERRELALERSGGDFVVRYHEHTFPVAPRSLAGLLTRAALHTREDELSVLADSLAALPLPTATEHESTERRHRHKAVLGKWLTRLLEREPAVAKAVDEAISHTNQDADELDELLSRQNYRLAHWRTAEQELGYRRFFDISSLVGLRVEDPEVFFDTHRLVLGWLRTGELDGVRIDHPDGLKDPEEYLTRLSTAAPGAWIVVEKILERGETLPKSWPVAGTTGYEFLNTAHALFVDPTKEAALSKIYTDFAGPSAEYAELMREKKLAVLSGALATDLRRLVALLVQVCQRHRRFRDYTAHELEQALGEVIANLPVYRTYARAARGWISDTDRAHWRHALEKATAAREDLSADLFAFIGAVMTLDIRGEIETQFVNRLQQLTGAVMAKGVEDTAMYCFNRFVSLNDVGGDPSRFGIDVAEFHRCMLSAPAEAMLSTSTHDTKRSEDVRARLAVLSELPDAWAAAVGSWSEHSERHRRGGLPDKNTEYLFWQTLVGAFPINAERLRGYMEKAIKEAKTHTSWTQPDADYEEATLGFVDRVLADDSLMEEVRQFVESVLGPGRINALSQKLLALTCPGVPDVYQGTELWDLSLVDPDNRRMPDFELRVRLLAELSSLTPEQILERMDEGLPKLWLVHRALRLRGAKQNWVNGTYEPLTTRGSCAQQLVGFTRGGCVAVVVPRLRAGAEDWTDTEVALPAGTWRNEFTGDSHSGPRVKAAELLGRFPVALLSKLEEEHGSTA